VPAPDESTQPLLTLYEQYLAELRRFVASKAFDPHAVDDVMQDILVRLLQYPTDEPLDNPVAYLFTVARNVLHNVNSLARTRREHLVDCPPNEIENYVSEHTRGDQLCVSSDSDALDTEEIERVLNGLPSKVRAALILNRRDGLTYKQTAARMHVSEHTAKKYICAGLKAFRQHFNGGIPPQPVRLPKS
jgi:RNA polymerase sigma factor (sigma-70 family)